MKPMGTGHFSSSSLLALLIAACVGGGIAPGGNGVHAGGLRLRRVDSVVPSPRDLMRNAEDEERSLEGGDDYGYTTSFGENARQVCPTFNAETCALASPVCRVVQPLGSDCTPPNVGSGSSGGNAPNIPKNKKKKKSKKKKKKTTTKRSNPGITGNKCAPFPSYGCQIGGLFCDFTGASSAIIKSQCDTEPQCLWDPETGKCFNPYCNDRCALANNGICEEISGLCAPQTDCSDCSKLLDDYNTVMKSANTCQWSLDGSCDDGGPGAVVSAKQGATSACAFGTDTFDCGVRQDPYATVNTVPAANETNALYRTFSLDYLVFTDDEATREAVTQVPEALLALAKAKQKLETMVVGSRRDSSAGNSSLPAGSLLCPGDVTTAISLASWRNLLVGVRVWSGPGPIPASEGCRYEASDGLPRTAILNLNGTALHDFLAADLATLRPAVTYLLHELVLALGFGSSDTWMSLVDENFVYHGYGGWKGYGTLLGGIIPGGGDDRRPKVENTPSSPRRLSHWRGVAGELMNSDSWKEGVALTQPRALSILTLRALTDLNYFIDASAAEELSS